MNPPSNGNGYWKGKTEATLEGIAKRLDDLYEHFENCAIGRKHDRQIAYLNLALFAIVMLLVVTHPGEMREIIGMLVR